MIVFLIVFLTIMVGFCFFLRRDSRRGSGAPPILSVTASLKCPGKVVVLITLAVVASMTSAAVMVIVLYPGAASA